MYLVDIVDSLGRAAQAVLGDAVYLKNQGSAGFATSDHDFIHVRLDNMRPSPTIGEGLMLLTFTISLWRDWPGVDADGDVRPDDIDICSAMLLEDAVRLEHGLRYARAQNWLIDPALAESVGMRSIDTEIGSMERLTPAGKRIGWRLPVTMRSPPIADYSLGDGSCPVSPYA